MTRVNSKKVKIYSTYAHILKYGCLFSKNPGITRANIRNSIDSLSRFFVNEDYKNIKIGNRFEITLYGYPSLKDAVEAAKPLL